MLLSRARFQLQIPRDVGAPCRSTRGLLFVKVACHAMSPQVRLGLMPSPGDRGVLPSWYRGKTDRCCRVSCCVLPREKCVAIFESFKSWQEVGALDSVSPALLESLRLMT